MAIDDIDKALTQSFIDGAFGMPIAHENFNYTPGNDAYIEIKVLQNDITPWSLSHSNETDGVLKLIIRWPVGVGAVSAKEKANEILKYFKIGKQISYGTTSLIIMSGHLHPGAPEAGWFKLDVTINYRAFISR